MKIRDKITLIFTLLTGTLLFLIFVFIYYFSYRYTENEFYLRLRERANIAAQVRLEQDELSAMIYNDIRGRHLQTLPGEQEVIFPVRIAERRIQGGPPRQLPGDFFERTFANGSALLKTGTTYHAGLLYEDNQGDFIVVVSAQNQYGQAEMRNLLNILILSYLIGLVLTYFTGIFYSARILKPISAITARANEISANNLDIRLETTHTEDELDQLAQTFNHMLDRLEGAFETQNNFINNASHELRNPLTAILGETEIALSRERSMNEYHRSLVTIQKEAQRLDLLVNSLLNLAQTGLEDKRLLIESLRIDELLMTVKRNLDTIQPDSQLRFDFTELPVQAELLELPGNESLLTVAFTNLIDNACKFSDNEEVTIRVTADRKGMTVSIADKGVGIPEQDLLQITEPFYRASNARIFKGFGVGLPLANKIIKLHGGQLRISSILEQGTTVTITFPANKRIQDHQIDLSLI